MSDRTRYPIAAMVHLEANQPDSGAQRGIFGPPAARQPTAGDDLGVARTYRSLSATGAELAEIAACAAASRATGTRNGEQDT